MDTSYIESTNSINNFFINPTIFLILFLVIIAYVGLFMSLGNSTNGSQESGDKGGMNVITIIAAIVLLFLILINIYNMYFSIDIITNLRNFFQGNPEIDIDIVQLDEVNDVDNLPEIKLKKQVYNIPGNYYNYENAKALCAAYGDRLANYEEIEDAYNKGGEWCNYGWSEGKMALFPTQKTTYDTLQKIEGHENDCGRPGINGGYMENPNLQFGVNCYGNKPKINAEEEEIMENTPLYPVTAKDIAFQKRIDYWKTQINDILVSPFNHDTWSKL